MAFQGGVLETISPVRSIPCRDENTHLGIRLAEVEVADSHHTRRVAAVEGWCSHRVPSVEAAHCSSRRNSPGERRIHLSTLGQDIVIDSSVVVVVEVRCSSPAAVGRRIHPGQGNMTCRTKQAVLLEWSRRREDVDCAAGNGGRGRGEPRDQDADVTDRGSCSISGEDLDQRPRFGWFALALRGVDLRPKCSLLRLITSIDKGNSCRMRFGCWLSNSDDNTVDDLMRVRLKENRWRKRRG